VLRGLGMSPADAAEVAQRPLPAFPPLSHLPVSQAARKAARPR
jgi:hypothetical protein